MRAAKIFITVFLIVLFFYVTIFTVIEHRRVTNGPWEVTFTTNALVINQPRLGLTNIQITLATPALAAATNLPTTLLFELNTPTPYAVPGGQCVFLDLLYHPGTVVLELGGHQLQLMPRILTVDHHELAWSNNSVLKLETAAK
ncbi:MAG: hypothetical protein RLZZ350_608 [Verrucomicrobiota bacterium]